MTEANPEAALVRGPRLTQAPPVNPTMARATHCGAAWGGRQAQTRLVWYVPRADLGAPGRPANWPEATYQAPRVVRTSLLWLPGVVIWLAGLIWVAPGRAASLGEA